MSWTLPRVSEGGKGSYFPVSLRRMWSNCGCAMVIPMNAELANIKRVNWTKRLTSQLGEVVAWRRRQCHSPTRHLWELGEPPGISLSSKNYYYYILGNSPHYHSFVLFLSFHAKLALVSCSLYHLCWCHPCSNRNSLLECLINPPDTQSCFQHRKRSVCEQYYAGRSNAACFAGYWQVHLIWFLLLVSILTFLPVALIYGLPSRAASLH